MIGDILPPAVAAVEAFADLDGVELFPEEEAAIRNAVEKRRKEFATVRHCAREALRAIGMTPIALVPGTRGAPGWPEGVVGSMTHCTGYRAAAVAHDRDIASVGIDAEPDEELPDGVLGMITSGAERAQLRQLAATDPSPSWDRLMFCAKEALYKAWYPVTHRWLDFAEAVVTIAPDATFAATVLVPGAVVGRRTVTEFHGRWLARSGLLVATVVVPGQNALPGSDPDEGLPLRP